MMRKIAKNRLWVSKLKPTTCFFIQKSMNCLSTINEGNGKTIEISTEKKHKKEIGMKIAKYMNIAINTGVIIPNRSFQ